MKELNLSMNAIFSAVAEDLNERNELFSEIMEEEVTNKEMLLVTHAGAALCAVLMFAGAGVTAAVCSVAYFMFSLYLCKKGGVK